MNKSKLNLFIFSTTSRLTIEVVGKLMFSEIIALLTLPFIDLKKNILQNRNLRIILTCLTILLISQILSDVINDSTLENSLKGGATILFAIITTIYLTRFLNKSDGIIYYLFGLFLVNLVFGEGGLEINMIENDFNYFKVRFVPFLNPLILILSYYFYKRKKIFTSHFIFISYAILCFTLDARSNGIIYLFSFILLYIKGKKYRLSYIKIAIGGLLILFFLYLGYIFYVDQVLNNGLGGYNAKSQLKLASNPYNPFELLYYGRAELAVLLEASLDKPFFGHGSWGADPNGKYAAMLGVIKDSPIQIETTFIRAHSILLGYFAYAGLMGFITLLVLFSHLFKIFYKLYVDNNYRSNLLPILIVLFFGIFWSFFFSPIQHLRTEFPLFASLIIVEYSRHQNLNSI